MLAEFIDRICSLAAKAQEPKAELIEELERVAVQTAEGTELHEIPPSRREHMVATVEALCEGVLALGDKKSSIFVGADNSWAFLDDADRRDMMVLRMNRSDRWAWLMRTAGSLALSQADAIKAIATLFWDEANEAEAGALIASMRTIAWARRSDGTIGVDRSKETLGRSVELEATSAVSIPERVTLRLSPWTNFDARVLVTLAVDLDLDEKRIVFTALGDHLALAMNDARGQLYDAITRAVGANARVHQAP